MDYTNTDQATRRDGSALEREVRPRHGVDCQKAPHRGGDLHAPEDDTPYNVDGCDYCGRCHMALTSAGPPQADTVRDALAGLVGWAQMILAQPDLPADLRARFSNNHRLTTAVLALASSA